MGDTHLKLLEQRLEEKGWSIVDRGSGDGYRVSGSWTIQRSKKKEGIVLEFDGFDDMKTLPLEKAYACAVKGKNDESIYFGSMKEFEKKLPSFLEELDLLEETLKYNQSVGQIARTRGAHD